MSRGNIVLFPGGQGPDPYHELCEDLRGRLRHLMSFDHGMQHSQHVAGFFVTAPARKDATGELEVTATVLEAVDDDVAAVLIYAGLLAVKQRRASAFHKLMVRLKETGQIP